MAMLVKWRFFRPRVSHLIKSIPASVLGQNSELFQNAKNIAESTLRSHPTIDDAIDTIRHRVQNAPSRERLLALTLLMVPRAARAQEMMDTHKHNFHDRKTRLFELIDFNDTFVATVLALTPGERHGFSDHLYEAMRQFSRQHKTPNFYEGQYQAIVHGLSREVAVYQAALDSGFNALMSSRTDDAFGVDMQIQDKQTGAYVNIDIKTHSSYYFRLKVLVREQRITQDQAEKALDTGYCPVIHHNDNIAVPIVLFRIDHTILGDIVDFAFTDEQRIREKIRYAIDTYSIKDQGYGKAIRPL